MTRKIPVKVGFLYRGVTKVVKLGMPNDLKKVKLVQDETYIIAKILPDMAGVNTELKKEGGSLKLTITLAQYNEHLVPGRSGYKDKDPYK